VAHAALVASGDASDGWFTSGCTRIGSCYFGALHANETKHGNFGKTIEVTSGVGTNETSYFGHDPNRLLREDQRRENVLLRESEAGQREKCYFGPNGERIREVLLRVQRDSYFGRSAESVTSGAEKGVTSGRVVAK
jgi:hypothetical protein